jgi:hypothetical protein
MSPVRWESIAAVAEGLRSCSFPAADFHHREHCLVTAYFLLTEPEVDWRAKLPALIKRYNLAMGGANTDSAGYHETITQFYLAAIAGFLQAMPRCSPEERCQAILGSPLADKDYILRFYSRELLFSTEARHRYVAPNLFLAI